MLGFRFIKTRPTDYVIHFKNGRVKRHGNALSFFYYAPSSSLVIVPAGSTDADYIFQETTADFQTISIQGQFTYRVEQPLTLASLLDYSISADGRYIGDGPEVLPVRLTNIVQVTLREVLKSMSLRESLVSATLFVEHTREALKSHDAIAALGLQILDFTILQISPTPDMARALEASARENLLKEADEAVYERRNFAVEQERRIKENELQTQISIEEKNRRIREEQMNAEIAVEQKKRVVEETKMESTRSIERMKKEIEQEKVEAELKIATAQQDLVAQRGKNTVEFATARAQAMRLEVEVLASLSPELIEALLLGQMDSGAILARAMKDLSRNADKIGNLNISPELMESILKISK